MNHPDGCRKMLAGRMIFTTHSLILVAIVAAVVSRLLHGPIRPLMQLFAWLWWLVFSRTAYGAWRTANQLFGP
jgi:hypothetical protein